VQVARRDLALVPPDPQTLQFASSHAESKLSEPAEHPGGGRTTTSSIVERGFLRRDRSGGIGIRVFDALTLSESASRDRQNVPVPGTRQDNRDPDEQSSRESADTADRAPRCA